MSNGNEIDDAWLSNIDASIHDSDFEFGGNEASSSYIHTDHGRGDDGEDNEDNDDNDSQKDSDDGDSQGPVNEGGGKQEADKTGKPKPIFNVQRLYKREEPRVRCQFCNKRASIKVVRKSDNEDFNFCCVCFAKDFGTNRALEDFWGL
jgi:hypothetical protein